MTSQTWLDLGPLVDFPEGRPVLRKVEGQRFACVRAGDGVHAIDDRCPHQGYPLSQGSCKDGVLTCDWHNWKFELETGDCTFGGEAVRRFPTRVEGGRVHLNPTVDSEREATRLRDGLLKAIKRGGQGRALREAMRLGEHVAHPRAAELGALAAGFEVLAKDASDRTEYGFDHSLAMFADLASFAERGWIGKEEAFVTATHAVAERSLHLPARPVPPADAAPDRALDGAAACEALLAERRDEAEARVRAIAREKGAALAAQALTPFLARHVYDYGHSVIFTAKALEICNRFPAITESVFGSLAVSLAWATADTALPPFTATRHALERLEAKRLGEQRATEWSAAERAAYELEVLSGEATAANATVAQLERGLDATTLLRAIAHAAATRIERFDYGWEERADSEVGVLEVTHTLTFTEGAIALAEKADPRDVARLAVLAAAFTGRVRRGDHEAPRDPPALTKAPDLGSALHARDAGRAIAIVREMSAAERQAAYQTIAPFAAFDAATRPILYAHTVKNTEAMRRLEQADPLADATYLAALLSYIVPVRREFHPRRVATVARKFMSDGRPPEGLY
jgi:nitrite reductase/ring-hydroxylating ferredoxin subunit